MDRKLGKAVFVHKRAGLIELDPFQFSIFTFFFQFDVSSKQKGGWGTLYHSLKSEKDSWLRGFNDGLKWVFG